MIMEDNTGCVEEADRMQPGRGLSARRQPLPPQLQEALERNQRFMAELRDQPPSVAELAIVQVVSPPEVIE